MLDLLKEKRAYKAKVSKKETKDMPFLKELTRSTVRGRKTLVFFIAFWAFCFSDMVQMSMSMKDLSSEAMAIMMIMIGLILSFVTLFLSLSSVVKGNAKTIAMMIVFGYKHSVAARQSSDVIDPFLILDL